MNTRLRKHSKVSRVLNLALFVTICAALGLFQAQGQSLISQVTNENPWLLITSLDATQRAEIARMATNKMTFLPDGLVGQKLNASQLAEIRDVFERTPRVFRNTNVVPYLKQQETTALCWAACVQPILAANGFPISQHELERLILKGQGGQGVGLSNLANHINLVHFQKIPTAISVLAFYYPFCPDGLGILRLLQERCLLVPINPEHVVLVTGFKTLGFMESLRLSSLEYFDPIDGQIYEWKSNQWEIIRTHLPGVLSIAALPRLFSIPQEKRFVVKRAERWLVVNSSGTKLIGEEFDAIQPFDFGSLGRIGSDWYVIQFTNVTKIGNFEDVRGYGFNSKHGNVAPAKRDGRWGLIDRRGNFVLTPQWMAIGTPSIGLTPVQTASGLWGYIRDDGELTIDPRFQSVTPFSSEGKALVRLHNSWRMIGTNGLSSGDAEFDEIADGGYGCIAGRKDGKWGYYGYSGNARTESKFEDAGPFSHMLAAAKEPGKDYGYVDVFGTYKIPPKYKAAQPFYSFDRAIVETSRGWGIIDRSGAYVLRPQYPYLTIVPEGHLVASDWFGQTWYIDESGKRVLPTGFDPLEGKVRGRQPVTVKLHGDWATRDFWFIPAYEWEEHAADLMRSATARLRFRAREATSTNGLLKVSNQIFIVLSEKGGRTYTNLIDVIPPGPMSFTFTD